MSKIRVNGAELYFQESGSGDETIVFSHGYLMNNTMYDHQISALKNDYRCLAYDHRGHGQSEVTANGYDLDNVVDDAIAFIESQNKGPVHFVGMSTGGFVGLRIALRRPELLKSLVLIDTSAEPEPVKALKKNNLLLWMVKYVGWWSVIRQVMPMAFHDEFLSDPNRQEEVNYWRNVFIAQDKKGVHPFGKGIFARGDVLPHLTDIMLPAAVIVGEKDMLTPIKCSQKMAEMIPNASLHPIANAGHSAVIEKPESVTKVLLDFYSTLKA